MLNETLLQEINTLAPEKVAEVFDFVAFLKSKKASSEGMAQPQSETWLQDLLRHMEQAHGHSGGKKWTREELHRG